MITTTAVGEIIDLVFKYTSSVLRTHSYEKVTGDVSPFKQEKGEKIAKELAIGLSAIISQLEHSSYEQGRLEERKEIKQNIKEMRKEWLEETDGTSYDLGYSTALHDVLNHHIETLTQTEKA